jgi:hypothetical protein
VDCRQACNHAERYADDGYESTIHVGAQPDPQVARVVTIRIVKSSIPTLEVAAFLSDAKNDGLKLGDADEYFELA